MIAMRASTTFFKNEIAACRKQIVGNRWEDRLAQKVLNDLERHPEVETMWNALAKILPENYPAREFILDVLASRVRAEKLKPVVLQLSAIEAKTLARNKRHLKKKNYRQAVHEIGMLAQIRDGRDHILSRESKTAARTYFMEGWGKKFKQLCGQPFDNIVALLTNITFDLRAKELGLPDERTEVTAEAARGARKPTSRRDRDTQTPK